MEDSGDPPCYDHPTLPDLLDPASIGWRWYGAGDPASLWNAPNAISHICVPNIPRDGTCGGVDWLADVELTVGQVLTDLGANPNDKKCDLRKVSWVIPDGNWSDHPGTVGNDGGSSWVSAIVNAVGGVDNLGNNLLKQCKNPDGSSYFDTTAVLITWDDWGGWYDHVLPWNCNGSGTCSGYPNATGSEYVYGFRVPLLVVSPYTQAGYVSGDIRNQGKQQPYIHDFGSILNFIEYAFGQNGRYLAPFGIGPRQYPYADYFAPDAPTTPGCNPALCPYSLSDFFGNFQTKRAFTAITGAKYATDCFFHPNIESCFGVNFTPQDPDNDAIEQ
jgi:Phosphoesterase family